MINRLSFEWYTEESAMNIHILNTIWIHSSFTILIKWCLPIPTVQYHNAWYLSEPFKRSGRSDFQKIILIRDKFFIHNSHTGNYVSFISKCFYSLNIIVNRLTTLWFVSFSTFVNYYLFAFFKVLWNIRMIS